VAAGATEAPAGLLSYRDLKNPGGRALGLCHHLGFTGLRTGDRNMLGLEPR
jgi:hypothetical protein